ncbi:hypothetical protein I308_101827 [Cryptococcus tetragattii IND107]|uniref:Uncharacterized protein n=1 Tax=Cryptococcus tetragattii IND107 TaxID=1296105 RepID=A0ABR3BX31_9TREE
MIGVDSNSGYRFVSQWQHYESHMIVFKTRHWPPKPGSPSMSPQQHPFAILTFSLTLDLLVHGRQSDTKKHGGDGQRGVVFTRIERCLVSGAKKIKPQAINTLVVRSMYHFCKVDELPALWAYM